MGILPVLVLLVGYQSASIIIAQDFSKLVILMYKYSNFQLGRAANSPQPQPYF
jgi:hypothetical protein